MSTTLTFTLGGQDVLRIAEAVTQLLNARPPRGWFDVSAAAEYTSLSPEAIRTAAKRGKLVGHRGESGRLVFRAEDLDAFMSSPN